MMPRISVARALSVAFAGVACAVPLFLSSITQGATIAICFGVGLLASALWYLRDTAAQELLPPLVVVLPGALCIFIAVFSLILSGVPLGVQLGAGFEMGTLGSYALFVIASLIGAAVCIRRASLMLILLEVASVVGTFVVIGVWLKLLPSVLLSFADFQLGLFFCAIALMAAVLFDITVSSWPRLWHVAVALLSVTGALLLFVPEMVFLVVGAALLYGIFVYMPEALRARRARVPLAALAIILVIVFAFLFGYRNTSISHITPSVRPSLRATQIVVGAAYAQSLPTALLGTGPASFSNAWNAYRPTEFNSTPLWNATPTTGYSTILTEALEVGLLGFAAIFLLPLVLLVWQVRKNFLDARSVGTAPAHGMLLLTLWCALLSYPTTTMLFVLWGLTIGGVIACSTSRRAVGKSAATHTYVAALALVGALCLGIGGLQLWAAWYDWQGLQSEKKSLPEAVVKVERAARIWGGTTLYQKHLAVLSTRSGALISQKRPLPAAAESMGDEFNRASTAIDIAVSRDPENIESLILKLTVYLTWAELGVESAASRAEETIPSLLGVRTPRPDVFYLIARLRLVEGNREAAREALVQALRLKSDYKEAQDALRAIGG